MLAGRGNLFGYPAMTWWPALPSERIAPSPASSCASVTRMRMLIPQFPHYVVSNQFELPQGSTSSDHVTAHLECRYRGVVGAPNRGYGDLDSVFLQCGYVAGSI